ncbi:abortive infection family protein [Sphingomonas daechungensis]|uniref:abortive infection family protein n=1 Tax=Sphingomonas daechungensis TaxID=1176646 RepID=UPI0037841298
MAEIKRTDMKAIENAFIASGYVLDFSDRTFAEWFEDELRVDIDDDKYRGRGSSKGNRLRGFVEHEPPRLVAKALRALWEYRQNMRSAHTVDEREKETDRRQLFAVIDLLEGLESAPPVDAIQAFASDETLAELVEAIRRDAAANKPEAALDRLHTFSMKKFAHLLAIKGSPADISEPLHSRVGRYVKLLEGERDLRPITKQIMKNCIGIFQQFNDVRNNASFAHDSKLVETHEARFIFETIVSMLRFVRSIEGNLFEAPDR